MMEYDDSFNNKAAAIWTLFISIHLNLYTLLRYCVGPLQELHSSKKSVGNIDMMTVHLSAAHP